jgi:Leucine-rich repeat (LRR) protein
VSPVDPALWYLHTLNRLEMRLPSGILTSISTNLMKLNNLQTLILENNSLVELPTEIGMLHKLKTLQVANNSLTLLPETLSNCLVRINFFEADHF